MLTRAQRKTAQAIVNLFETGSVLGDYGRVTLIPGDTGHLTFGRSQTTLGSRNLHDLLQRYCSNAGARFAAMLQPFLSRFAARDLSLDGEPHLHNILRASADDSVMRETQDRFFDDTYWRPAERQATQLGITSPLGVAVVYDSAVHGSWKAMKDRTLAANGNVAALGEQAWIRAYVKTRRNWLATHSRADLRPTAYRMDAFQRLVDQSLWGLPLPLVVRGAEISMATLNGTPPGSYDGPQPGTRGLALQSPMLRGLDVRLVQLGLSHRKVDIVADGVFGQTSSKLVKQYQTQRGLAATGVVDPALIVELTS